MITNVQKEKYKKSAQNQPPFKNGVDMRNQYIITEETIGTLERELDCVLMAKDDYAQGYKDAIKSAVKMMRSRPYNPQAEREKVLDLVCEILKHEWNNSNNLSREQKDERQIAVLHIRNQVAELRQKDGE